MTTGGGVPSVPNSAFGTAEGVPGTLLERHPWNRIKPCYGNKNLTGCSKVPRLSIKVLDRGIRGISGARCTPIRECSYTRESWNFGTGTQMRGAANA